MTVDIYTETTFKSPRRQTGIIAYIIVARYGSGHEDFTEKRMMQMRDSTMQEAELLVAAMAVARAASMARIAGAKELNIISSNPWVGQMAQANLGKWQENGYKNAKGEDIKYKDWWQAISKVKESRILNFTKEHDKGSGLDGYQTWLKEQLEKSKVAPVQRKGAADGKVI